MPVKIYTKTGDKGKTSLVGGFRVNKSDLRLDAYGTVDELNSRISLLISLLKEVEDQFSSEVFKQLNLIQNELFIVGADLAAPLNEKRTENIQRIEEESTIRLETEIDIMANDLMPIKNFILPGGSKISANIHIARTVCRRAERMVVKLSDHASVNEQTIIYLNRLSDWLFTLARYVNKTLNIEDTIWKN